jgi:hypothetical protein
MLGLVDHVDMEADMFVLLCRNLFARYEHSLKALCADCRGVAEAIRRSRFSPVSVARDAVVGVLAEVDVSQRGRLDVSEPEAWVRAELIGVFRLVVDYLREVGEAGHTELCGYLGSKRVHLSGMKLSLLEEQFGFRQVVEVIPDEPRETDSWRDEWRLRTRYRLR